MNYTKINISKNEEGYGTLWDAVRSDLRIREEFDMYDKNGSKIYTEDFHLLTNNSLIYICPRKRDFSYQSMLDSYIKVKKLGQGGYGSVYLLKHKLNGEYTAAKFVDVTQFLSKADNIQKALKEAQYLLTMDHENIINLETVFLLQ